VLDYLSDPTIDQSWLPSSAWRRPHCRKQVGFAQYEADFAEEVPVMLGTVLGLEILLREPCLDLQMASEMVLSDVGATIQILGLIGREDYCAVEGPRRMVDCLASLDVGVWFGTVSARTFACDNEHAAMTAVWRQCRLVAQYAQLVAESFEGISSDDAYLVGLLHRIGAIAAVLGWPQGNLRRRDPSALLTMEKSLPLFVLAAMRSFNDPSTSSTWKLILTAAHELAGTQLDFGASDLQTIDSMGICSRWEGFLPVPVTRHSDALEGEMLDARERREVCCGAKGELCPGIRFPANIGAGAVCATAQDVSCSNQLLDASATIMS